MPLTPEPYELRNVLAPEERAEYDGLSTAYVFGAQTVPGLERMHAIEAMAQQRWDLHPDHHVAVPGPSYWNYRCLVCSEPVDWHISTPRYLARKVWTWLRAYTNL